MASDSKTDVADLERALESWIKAYMHLRDGEQAMALAHRWAAAKALAEHEWLEALPIFHRPYGTIKARRERLEKEARP